MGMPAAAAGTRHRTASTAIEEVWTDLYGRTWELLEERSLESLPAVRFVHILSLEHKVAHWYCLVPGQSPQDVVTRPGGAIRFLTW